MGAAEALAEYTVATEDIAPYVPGEFFRRELPCILAVIGQIKETLTALVVDGYVRLRDGPGLGQHLYDHYGQKIPVIGVAKSYFHDAPAVEVFRGGSRRPLYVTAAGIDVNRAAEHVRGMHGPNRIPMLLKRVDQIGRGR